MPSLKYQMCKTVGKMPNESSKLKCQMKNANYKMVSIKCQMKTDKNDKLIMPIVKL